jgi:hypothetical protein
MAHVRQSRPDSGLGAVVRVLESFEVFPLRSTVWNEMQLPEWNKDWFGTGFKVPHHQCLHCESGPLESCLLRAVQLSRQKWPSLTLPSLFGDVHYLLK